MSKYISPKDILSTFQTYSELVLINLIHRMLCCGVNCICKKFYINCPAIILCLFILFFHFSSWKCNQWLPSNKIKKSCVILSKDISPKDILFTFQTDSELVLMNLIYGMFCCGVNCICKKFYINCPAIILCLFIWFCHFSSWKCNQWLPSNKIKKSWICGSVILSKDI